MHIATPRLILSPSGGSEKAPGGEGGCLRRFAADLRSQAVAVRTHACVSLEAARGKARCNDLEMRTAHSYEEKKFLAQLPVCLPARIGSLYAGALRQIFNARSLGFAYPHAMSANCSFILA